MSRPAEAPDHGTAADRRRSRFGDWSATATHHTPAEDAQAILTGVLLAALGLSILAHLKFLTGGVAGLALIVSYVFGINVGLAFFLINIPFYALAAGRMGRAFTLKTFVAIALLSLVSWWLPLVFKVAYIDPLAGAVIGGLLIGFALLALFRHRASLGGAGILAIYLQDRFGFRAGLVQLAFDLTILVIALFVVEFQAVIFSLVGALVLNGFLAVNHRTDRYIAT
ncbi:YitT family protein [Jiella sonneratiae]|uniref:YitT family protein n=1 Tax=Jiella sonneratiae TaxID=2816856 RepID=A0ABS3J8P8_9HYPH|nr:YitT family protein [Jiella sonneratiae]MBO0905515.1 YitT family protein [Jiella sonneratiae]